MRFVTLTPSVWLLPHSLVGKVINVIENGNPYSSFAVETINRAKTSDRAKMLSNHISGFRTNSSTTWELQTIQICSIFVRMLEWIVSIQD